MLKTIEQAWDFYQAQKISKISKIPTHEKIWLSLEQSLVEKQSLVEGGKFDNQFFYDTGANNHQLVERIPKKIRHPKSPKGKSQKMRRDKESGMNEKSNPIVRTHVTKSHKWKNNIHKVNSFPMTSVMKSTSNKTIDPIVHSTPFKIKFEHVFVMQEFGISIKGDEFEDTMICLCSSIKECLSDAKQKCKNNRAKIESLLEHKVGHIVPLKIKGVIVGYAVSILGVSIEACISQKETRGLPKGIKYRRLENMSLKEVFIKRLA